MSNSCVEKFIHGSIEDADKLDVAEDGLLVGTVEVNDMML